MKTSEASQLPDYKVEEFSLDLGDGPVTWLEVTCPRCGVEFWARVSWRNIYNVQGASDRPPARPHGRSCPYCFKASAIPEEWRIYTNQERPKPGAPKRRIVRRRRSA